ncbi:hypothetical protein VTK56DRAFT_6086 [Thermocarpiscus australiensis]
MGQPTSNSMEYTSVHYRACILLHDKAAAHLANLASIGFRSCGKGRYPRESSEPLSPDSWYLGQHSQPTYYTTQCVQCPYGVFSPSDLFGYSLTGLPVSSFGGVLGDPSRSLSTLASIRSDTRWFQMKYLRTHTHPIAPHPSSFPLLNPPSRHLELFTSTQDPDSAARTLVTMQWGTYELHDRRTAGRTVLYDMKQRGNGARVPSPVPLNASSVSNVVLSTAL